LQLRYDEPESNFAFDLNVLRPYTSDYVFKSDLVAMMREVALSKKTDQDQLRDDLAKLKASSAEPFFFCYITPVHTTLSQLLST